MPCRGDATLRILSTLLFVLVGVVNTVPVSGAFSADRLQALYGLAFEGDDLLILMRHRAVLFAIVGGLLFASAFHRPLRPIGIAAGLLSMLSFVAIAWLVGDHNALVRRVVVIDVVASAALVFAGVLDARVGAREAGARHVRPQDAGAPPPS